MKRVVRSLLLFFCTTLFMLSASVCVCVIRVHADGGTYFPITANGKFEIAEISPTSHEYINISNFSSEVRMVRWEKSNSTWFYAVSLNPFTYQYTGYSSGGINNASSYTWRGVTYYTGAALISPVNVSSVIPLVPYTNQFGDDPRTAIYYSFGDGSVSPVSWGLVDVKGYQTNIAGQGQASINNVDVISWDNAIDTLGNDISSGNVRIRLIPGEYTGDTKNSLISKLYTDFILDIVHATDGNVFPVSDGSASFKWSDVINTLNIPFVSVYSLINENDAWLKRGWIYEIRLEIDDYIGEWQPIYASTSSGVENDMNIVNTTVITQDTITAIQNINSINSTTNIWIINGQPVDPNPEQKPPEDENEKPWWVYLLEMINNTLGIQNEYINEGTDESKEEVNNFEGEHTELNNTVNDYHDIENDLVLDMNNNLEQIEVESDLVQNNSFISSARWVAEQYTRITTDNPIGSILKFSLVLGFVMIFLGRFRT